MTGAPVRTTCPYCGTGCGLLAHVEGGRLERVEGDALHPVNRGATCQKPLRLPDAVAAPDRATHVLRRPSADHRWEAAGWDEAIADLAGRLGALRDAHGPDAIALYLSGQLLTEDYYAAVKLFKGFLGTNNVDSNSRLCMSSAVAGYRGSLGSDGPPPGYADLSQADCLLVRGVHPFRTLADVRAILTASERVRRAVVIGGGLLGIEAARALRGRGLQVTLVHRASRLMETQLDEVGARLLSRALTDVRVVLDGETAALEGEEAVAGVALADGETLPAELVVVATGIRPETALAAAAGLEVRRGIVVDDGLRASAPNVWAVGECAEHRGVVHGLWPPLRAMAQAAGATIAGRAGAFHGALTATTLKVSGIDLFCAGDPALRAGDEEVLELDTRRGRYKRLIVRDGRLAGATLLGDLADAPRLRELAVSGAPVPDDVLGVAAGPAHAASGDELVCSCQAVPRRAIEAAIRANALTTVEQVGRHTQAGTGCGGCRVRVQALLDEAQRDAIEELREGASGAAA